MMNRVIPENFVFDTWMGIENIQDENKLVELSQKFLETQSELADFLLSSSDTFSEDISEFIYYAGVVIWICFDRFFEKKLRKIDHNEIKDELRDTEDQLIQYSASESKSIWDQPFLVKYVMGLVFEFAQDYEESFKEDEEGLILLLLISHINCLNQATSLSQ